MRKTIATGFLVALGLSLPGVTLAGRNSSGTMSVTSVAGGYPFISGQVISSSGMNSNMAELATELTDSLSRSGKGGMSAPLRCSDGSVSLPAFSWTNDTNSGMYRIGVDNIGIATGGTKRVDVSNTGIAFTDPASFASSVTVAGRFSAATYHAPVNFDDAATFASSVTISGVAHGQTPTLSNHLATKGYVDDLMFDAGVIVTTGAPGTVGFLWTPTRGIASVAIVTAAAPASRAVRFTFSSAMPDTNYAVLLTRHYNPGDGSGGSHLHLFTRTTTYFDVGVRDGGGGTYPHIDNTTLSFSALVAR
jgi:hypothetical protein